MFAIILAARMCVYVNQATESLNHIGKKLYAGVKGLACFVFTQRRQAIMYTVRCALKIHLEHRDQLNGHTGY